MKTRKRIIIAGAMTFLLMTPSLTMADQLHQQLSQYQQQYNALDNQQKQQQQQESDVAARAAGFYQTINTLNENISASQKEIVKAQNDINNLALQQQQLADQRQKAINELGFILKMNYEGGVSNYLEILMEANSLSDLIDRVEQISYVVKGYEQAQQTISDLDKNITAKKEAAKEKKAALQTEIADQQQSKLTNEQSMQKLNALLNKLTSTEKTTLQAKSQAQANIDDVQQLIRREQIDAENAKQHPILSRGGGISFTQPVKLEGTVGNLISYAENYTGVPYVWGGTTPSGFDCSGFVQYVFRHFGIQLPRVSQDQYNVGVPVSKSELQPGDIVFFSTYAPGASHEGIYMGNDMMIDAESRGVIITHLFGSSYWGPRYIGARRVIQKH